MGKSCTSKKSVENTIMEVMRYFSEGIEVLQSVASLWDGGKKVFVREATGITTVQ